MGGTPDEPRFHTPGFVVSVGSRMVAVAGLWRRLSGSNQQNILLNLLRSMAKMVLFIACLRGSNPVTDHANRRRGMLGFFRRGQVGGVLPTLSAFKRRGHPRASHDGVACERLSPSIGSSAGDGGGAARPADAGRRRADSRRRLRGRQ